MKEIHFYTNLSNVEQCSDWDLDTMCTDYEGTERNINNPDENIVKTTMLSFLQNTWYYIDLGWKVFIHNDNKTYEVKEHMKGIDKDIRKGHDMLKVLVGGVFGKIK